ncbi:MAG: hypothetical protein HW421_3442 [Ignavibacteria bacterium]|nr:hypothetical protein [Ignavibacteria bacterium]
MIIFVLLNMEIKMQSTQGNDYDSILNKIYKLPLPLAMEANNYIDFLLAKRNKTIPDDLEKKQLKAGFAKGFFEMSPDFDEPLDDFKDYMP